MKAQPKLEIGDTLFYGIASHETVRYPCPDCLGEKVWYIRTPAGEELTVGCGTCSHGYDGSRGYVEKYEYQPIVKEYTVGQVRIEEARDVVKIEYMCNETGVGSGTIYTEEKTAWITKASAMEYALSECARKQREYEERQSPAAKKKKATGKRAVKYDDKKMPGRAFLN